ncbi:MAG: UbiA family prenyltransferase, partial [Bacteroidota bacterium]
MNLSVKQILITYLQLTKPIITLSVAFSALTGYILHSGGFSPGWLSMYFGVLCIAAGSSALNQIQELTPDEKMERTRNRPLPSGRISRRSALIFALLLMLAGGGLLWIDLYATPALLAFFTLV